MLRSREFFDSKETWTTICTAGTIALNNARKIAIATTALFTAVNLKAAVSITTVAVGNFLLAAAAKVAAVAMAVLSAVMTAVAAHPVAAGNRPRLEQLCRYTARSAISSERLEAMPDGRFCYHFKRLWHNGASEIVFDPLELVSRMAALVPPPRFNLVRYSGVFAPCSKWREEIFPMSAQAAAKPPEPDTKQEQPALPAAATPAHHERRYSWAELLKRVFAIDVLECPRCHGRMRVYAQ